MIYIPGRMIRYVDIPKEINIENLVKHQMRIMK